MVGALAVFLLAGIQGPAGPAEFGESELRQALVEKGLASTTVGRILDSEPRRLPQPPTAETYRVQFSNGRIDIRSSDKNGLMYGLLEAAERIRNAGKDAWKQPVVEGKPYLAERGWNMFLPLPWDYERNFVDNDPAALTDPNRWFFQNEDYWRTLFAQMARSRLNWLDIHGPYDLDTTRFPNLYAYFIQSDTFPKVGVDPAIKAKNLHRLRWIIRLAHAHGIKVSLMSYEARFDIPQNPNPGYRGTEQEVYDYTKEVVEKMIRFVPELDKLGFRIGESGRGAEFFKCYQQAVKASGRNIPLYTRSWVTRKARVVPLARESHDFTVEIKYNGEQWGAPYIMAGGRTANWYSYWYEDYLSDSGPERGVRMWPGVERSDPATYAKGSTPSRWPAQPYKIIWQVRANGTHRIFPFYQPEWTRRSILSMKMGTATGYTVESMGSYFPQEPRYYWAGPKLPYKWTFERDEMYMACWGRLGYDPKSPDWKFDRMVMRKFGKEDGKDLARAWKEASKVIPLSFLAHGLGPDHRSHAPELEWGGDPGAYLESEPFDSHVFMSAKEELALRATGGKDGRIRATEASNLLAFLAPPRSEFHPDKLAGLLTEIYGGIHSLQALANYNEFRLLAAVSRGAAESGLSSAEESKKWDEGSQLAMGILASGPGKFYKPFTDRLRMHTHAFHWSGELAKLNAVTGKPAEALSWPNRGELTRPVAPKGVLELREGEGTVLATLSKSTAVRAWLLEKPLPSSTFFHKTPMRKVGGQFVAVFKREPWGHCVAAEVEMASGVIRRLPWWEKARPYLVVPSRQKPTPPIYSSEEALAFLKPEVLDPAKYGWLLVATRGEDFHHSFNRQTQRKLLSAVERGMNVLVMQQDYTSGRYPLDWLPSKPSITNRRENVFDPGGALGLEKVAMADAMWQPVQAGQGWKVQGNGSLASLTWGKGTIWLMQGRLVQRMHIPGAAKNLKRLLEACSPLRPAPEGAGGKRLPAVLVDAGSEGDLSSSVIPDFMNAHDIPFLTLGEVVAKEQGMDSLTPIPGPVGDDDLLGGKGGEIANKWLRGQVMAASRRATPANRDEFEKERKRRKAELYRSLGLEPMPAKTPLNARITGTIQRPGYRIEKLVFESRPRFFVTAHVYVPDPKPVGRLPVVVHVNGHWAHKKGEDRIQLRAAFCALQGYLAIAIDSPGRSFEGNALIERREEGDHNDWGLAMATNATGYYVWDVIRGLDYLETRPDADMTRVGITGASGGGLATLYAFAAEDRFKAAVPVVYMSSMELAPDNGCLCNHVPGTCQIGDRSDVAAIQAPKPIYIFGAQDDPEFPPDAMRLTGRKLADTWKLFGKESDAQTRIFNGPHDYNQLMREAMIGFFNKHLRGVGDGSPVAQPPLQALNPEDRSILVLDPPEKSERTMRDLTDEYLRNAPKAVTAEEALGVNGGRPTIRVAQVQRRDVDGKSRITFEPAPGLVTPAVLVDGTKPGAAVIVISDNGKLSAQISSTDGFGPRLYLDVLGIGELADFELRYPAYLGQAPAFIGGMQAAAAYKLLKSLGIQGPIELEGRGPYSSQVALWAGLLEPGFASVRGISADPDWSLENGAKMLQPRAHLLSSLPSLRKLVKNGQWSVAHD